LPTLSAEFGIGVILIAILETDGSGNRLDRRGEFVWLERDDARNGKRNARNGMFKREDS